MDFDCITSNLVRKDNPTNVFITAKETGLSSDSVVLFNQLRSLDKSRLQKKIGSVPKLKMIEVGEALKISLNL